MNLTFNYDKEFFICERFVIEICRLNFVARTGFEPVIPALRGRCPKPLDERANVNFSFKKYNKSYKCFYLYNLIYSLYI